MPKFDLDELLSFEEVRLRAAHICELTRVHRPCVSILRAPQPTVRVSAARLRAPG